MGIFNSLKNRKPKHSCAICHMPQRVPLIPTTLGGMCEKCFKPRFKQEVTEKIVELSKDKSYIVKELENGPNNS